MSSSTALDSTTQTGAALRRGDPRLLTAVGGGGIVLALIALLGPDLTVSHMGMGAMNMTHYMELLNISQPRNLLVFMALPVVLVETLAISELAILFGRAPGWVHRTSRVAGLLAGPVMLAIFLHLLVNAVVPLFVSGGWRGPADVIAVGFYLLGVVPFIGITLVELGVLGRESRDARRLHATFVAAFLVVAHVAMIFGMLDPTLMGYHMMH